MDTRIQQRRTWFWFGLLAFCIFLFIVFPWPIALTILILLAIFLSGAITALWRVIQQPPIQTSEHSSYEQGYQAVSRQPLDCAAPKDEPFNEDAPQVQHLQQYH